MFPPGIMGCYLNHSVNFAVEPSTGVHTQNVKSYWNRVKNKVKTDERMPWSPTPKLSGQVYVEGTLYGTSTLLFWRCKTSCNPV